MCSCYFYDLGENGEMTNVHDPDRNNFPPFRFFGRALLSITLYWAISMTNLNYFIFLFVSFKNQRFMFPSDDYFRLLMFSLFGIFPLSIKVYIRESPEASDLWSTRQLKLGRRTRNACNDASFWSAPIFAKKLVHSSDGSPDVPFAFLTGFSRASFLQKNVIAL